MHFETLCEGCALPICADGDHSMAPCLGHYVCAPDYDPEAHTICLGCYTGICQEFYNDMNHDELECGHYKCADDFNNKNHDEAPCGIHYQCKYGYDATQHTDATCEGCGKSLCSEGKHVKCDGCDMYICNANYIPANHGLADCDKHYKCATNYKADEHGEAACGHYECEEAEFIPENHAQCQGCNMYICNANYILANHELAICRVPGHHVCDGKAHFKDQLACKHKGCEDGNHDDAGCGVTGHYNCDGKDHSWCTECNANKCKVACDHVPAV